MKPEKDELLFIIVVVVLSFSRGTLIMGTKSHRRMLHFDFFSSCECNFFYNLSDKAILLNKRKSSFLDLVSGKLGKTASPAKNVGTSGKGT